MTTIKRKVDLIAAPMAMQPGNYVPRVFSEHAPATRYAELQLSQQGDWWQLHLRWPCATPINDNQRDSAVFVDAAAIFVPQQADAPWITMGAPQKPVQGLLWRADKIALLAMHAEGLGTTQRSDTPTGWRAEASTSVGMRELLLTLDPWPLLSQQRQLGLAIWQGSISERAGIKSVSPGWLALGDE